MPSDYGSYAGIHNELYPNHPLEIESLKHEDWWFGRTRFKQRRYVAEVDGRVVAVGSFSHEVFSYNPAAFLFRIEVSPNSQRKGIGTTMYETLMSELRTIRAERIWTSVFTPGHSPKFVKDRGFVETRRALESVLDLSTVDFAKLGHATAKAKVDGIDLDDLAGEIEADPDAGRKLFDLEMGANEDVPNVVRSEPLTYEEYSMVILESPGLIPAGCFVAKMGGRYIGSSNLWKTNRDGYLGQGFTAVRREFRGRGIALALKLLVAKSAAERGTRFLRTSNDSANAPILALNRKLGFVPSSTWTVFEKQVR